MFVYKHVCYTYIYMDEYMYEFVSVYIRYLGYVYVNVYITNKDLNKRKWLVTFCTEIHW